MAQLYIYIYIHTRNATKFWQPDTALKCLLCGWNHNVPLKPRYQFTKLHGITSQETVVFTVIFVRSKNFANAFTAFVDFHSVYFVTYSYLGQSTDMADMISSSNRYLVYVSLFIRNKISAAKV
jgi:hypothetical protein